jgi:hypothetical protein
MHSINNNNSGKSLRTLFSAIPMDGLVCGALPDLSS